jgi:N6-adenosine-specific RNA methylase IME4
MTQLVKYSAAVSALAACVRVDEAKGIRDQAEAMRVYARQANNRDMEITAAEIRLRAEFRLGELIMAQKATVGLNAGSRGAGRPAKAKGASAKAAPKDTRPKLADVGVSHKLSMRSQRLASQTPTQFAKRLLAWRQQAEASAERVSVDLMRDQDKKAARDRRERVMGGLQLAQPRRKFGVIYVDVPRKFKRHSDVTGMDRAPENHYRTMTFEQLLDLPVQKMTHDDAVIFYWSTAASLLDDLEILADWGFAAFRPRDVDGKILRNADAKRTAHQAPHINTRPRKYCTHQVWDKVRIGTGYWVRDRHEVLLIATKGKPPAPAPGTQDDSIFAEKKTKHSAKPDRTRELIERLYPTMPKCELFARTARKGWQLWGDQAPGARFKRKIKPKRKAAKHGRKKKR